MMASLTESLLEAHVRHELERWRGSRGQDSLTRWISAAYAWLESLRVSEVVSYAQVMDIIDRYVIGLRVSGGVTELAGEMARVVFNSPRSAETRLDDVLPDNSYERFAEKVTALDGVRRELLSIMARSEAFGVAIARMIIRVIGDLILGGRLDGRVGRRLLPALERQVARAILRRRHAQPGVEHHLMDVLDPECVRSVADEIWLSLSSLRLADAFKLITEDDLEDFVALGYEFWIRYRRSDYFREVCAEVLKHFFRKYGEGTVGALALDMGITEAMVITELQRTLWPLLERAEADGFLERQIRSRLAPFYRSPALLDLLASRS